jgi:predicted ATP-grasp superfamily ATP-dependent carboligase
VRIHVFEFICGGGLAGLPLPLRLAREGDLMLAALIGDLLELPGVQVSFSRDERLALPPRLAPARVCWRSPREGPDAVLAREIRASEATWPIAPETGGELERCARAVIDAGRVLFGPRPEAIALAASKSATAKRLARAGIDVVPCYGPASRWEDRGGRWVVKPDDGAGCCGMRLFSDRRSAAAALTGDGGSGRIAQPWIDGEPMSLSVLAGAGAVDVLSVNRQLVRSAGPSVEIAAIEVNCAPVTAPLRALAERVVAAMPGLQGYFGIDFVQTARGPVVLEVNPRLTSSYVGLRPALGLNVAARVLAAQAGTPAPPAGARAGRPVMLDLEADASD